MATGWVFSERYLWHDTGTGTAFLPSGGWLEPDTHIENPAPKRRFRNLIEVSGALAKLTQIEPRLATDEELCRIHKPEYVELVERVSAEGGGEAGREAPLGAGGAEIARLAAGGCLAALEAIVEGRIDNAYALVRPPGHHAGPDGGLGFCIYSNAAIAAAHARAALGLKRVAIIDWDAHHGNGAEQAFWAEPDVLTISIHQDGAFPHGSGPVDARGEGEGLGANLNIPLPPGSGVGAYLAAFERVIIPALDLFEPDMILVACGFDPSPQDPLARMMVTSEGFREMTRLVMEAADRHCGDRLLLMNEGGYAGPQVPFCGLAVVEQLGGFRTEVEDPFLPGYAGFPYQDLQAHQDAAIVAAAEGLPLLEELVKGRDEDG
jgi:acetoin utilization deacetylase AcuC-like enzyme